MKPRGRLYGRLLFAGVAASGVVGMVCFLAAATVSGEPLESLLSLAFVVSGAGCLALGVAWIEDGARRDDAAWNALFGVDDSRSLGSDWERWPRPPRKPRPKILDEPRDSAFWMKRLAKCYARLARLEELDAPETIIENEQRMIRETIALLSPPDALAVMRSWPQLASGHMKKRRPAPPENESN